MRCFFCPEMGEEGDSVVLDKAEHKHIFSVLRMREGSEILLIDGKGRIGVALVDKLNTLKVIRVEQKVPPRRKIHLFLTSPRKKKMDQLLKQCAEVGIWSIQPMVTERSVSTPEKGSILDHWSKELLEGCKQAHNPFLPLINLPVSFKRAIEIVQELNLCPLFGAVRHYEETFSLLKETLNDIAWFVGPEGGFTEAEHDIMMNAGFSGLKIGNWIMRVETAAIVGPAFLQQFE